MVSGFHRLPWTAFILFGASMSSEVADHHRPCRVGDLHPRHGPLLTGRCRPHSLWTLAGLRASGLEQSHVGLQCVATHIQNGQMHAAFFDSVLCIK